MPSCFSCLRDLTDKEAFISLQIDKKMISINQTGKIIKRQLNYEKKKNIETETYKKIEKTGTNDKILGTTAITICCRW